MRIISKIFWAILQHISAPSEKEIRERLLALLLVFLIWAPAFALPITPDQAEVRADQELEEKYRKQSDDLTMFFNEQVIWEVKRGIRTHIFTVDKNFCEEAITLFKNDLFRANWDVYDNSVPGGDRMLKIVRYNTVPE